ncbi:MAG: CorA family divalent cation transporter [Christensenella sp.]
MKYKIHEGAVSPTETSEIIKDDSYISIIPLNEASEHFSHVFPRELSKHIFKNSAMRFEHHENIDLLCIPLFRSFREKSTSPPVYVTIQKNSMDFICTDCAKLEPLLDSFIKSNADDASMGQLVCTFFEYLLRDDLETLEDIEVQISNLEDRVLTDKQGDFTSAIIQERKRLMMIMRYYEELLNILESIGMNEQHAFGSTSTHYLNIICGKAQRLYDKTKTMREYVSEIREAYQAEVDIRTNNIMKVLTIVTIIFMPLTLIVGWYGMNFIMPEYGFAVAYPIVIVASILVAVVGILYFKKHKWF